MTARDVVYALRTPVTLLLLLAVLGYGAWWGYKTVIAPAPKNATPCVTRTASELLPNQVTVKVLNGGDVRGFATDVAKTLRARGYNVSAVGNTDNAVTQTTIVGAAAENPEVVLVASNFSEATIRPDNRADHTVDVILGPKNADPMPGQGFQTSIPLPGGTVCLPSSATPTASATATP